MFMTGKYGLGYGRSSGGGGNQKSAQQKAIDQLFAAYATKNAAGVDIIDASGTEKLCGIKSGPVSDVCSGRREGTVRRMYWGLSRDGVVHLSCPMRVQHM